MVRHLLIVCFGAMVQMSCLLSNPPDFEEPMSYGPVIYQTTPMADLYAIDRDADPGMTNFRAWARDYNLDQTLLFRWYLDFGRDRPRCGCIRSFQALPLDEGRHLADYTLPHSLSTLDPGSCHRLTVVFTDGQWTEDPEGCDCPWVGDGENRTSNDWWLGVADEEFLIDEVSFGDCLALSSSNPLAEPEL